jgi:hypothetical protein
MQHFTTWLDHWQSLAAGLVALLAARLETISAISAVIAAVLWIASAIGKMPKRFPIRVISWHMHNGESVTGSQVVGEGFGESEELEHLGAVLRHQSQLSALAAIFAAISALSHAVALFYSN